MKTILATIFAIVSLASNAQAIYQPGFERGLYQSNLTVKEAQGTLAQVESIHVLKYSIDGQQKEFFTVTLDNGAPARNFVVTYKQDIGCGSSKLIADQINTGALGGTLQRLEIIDHTSRLCDDVIPFLLSVKITSALAGHGIVGTLTAETMAVETLYTIQ